MLARSSAVSTNKNDQIYAVGKNIDIIISLFIIVHIIPSLIYVKIWLDEEANKDVRKGSLFKLAV